MTTQLLVRLEVVAPLNAPVVPIKCNEFVAPEIDHVTGNCGVTGVDFGLPDERPVRRIDSDDTVYSRRVHHIIGDCDGAVVGERPGCPERVALELRAIADVSGVSGVAAIR